MHNRHPWIFSGAISSVEGNPENGKLVLVCDTRGTNLAIAYYNDNSQIVGRILSFGPDLEPIDETFWEDRIQQAYDLRQALELDPLTNSYRLVNAESDHLPGLVVDRYGPYLVMQCLTMGIDVRRQQIASILSRLPLPDGSLPKGVLNKSDVDVRRKEGLKLEVEVMSGEIPNGPIEVQENGFDFHVDLTSGHKTGFYLDQRENRARLMAPPITKRGTVLNCFAYTGSFAVYAAAAGAERIINVDSSIPALELAEQNVLNNYGGREADEYIAGDAFEVLRHYRDEELGFDTVILDPPKFVTSKNNLDKASRGYKDINRLGLQLLNPGGHLITFSCSGLLSEDLFLKILFSAAVEAGRDVSILEFMSQAPDHPISVTFPEGRYLKGFLCRVA